MRVGAVKGLKDGIMLFGRGYTGLVATMIAVWLWAPEAVRAGDDQAGEGPEEFPSVTLEEDSTPRFGAFYLDPWHEDILYVLFDGNRETGYRRMYAWIPGSRDYDDPVPLSVDADNRFRTISWRAEKDDEIATTDYAFRSWRSTGTHGERTHIDYVTGETQVRAARPFTNINIRYTLDYMRDRAPRGGELAAV